VDKVKTVNTEGKGTPGMYVGVHMAHRQEEEAHIAGEVEQNGKRRLIGRHNRRRIVRRRYTERLGRQCTERLGRQCTNRWRRWYTERLDSTCWNLLGLLWDRWMGIWHWVYRR